MTVWPGEQLKPGCSRWVCEIRMQHRADERGQSLQQYLSGELRGLAERPTTEEVLARIARHRGGQVGLEQAVIDLSSERNRR